MIKLRKVVTILLAITLVLVSFYTFTRNNQQLSLEFLYPSDRQVVEFELEPETSIGDLISDLETFSTQHNISIAQVVVFFDLNVNFYMTNIENNPNIDLLEGEYPIGNTHLSNLRFDEANVSQSGQFLFPISNLDIRIYEMDQVRNIGFVGTFHLIGANEEIAEAFMEEFSIYGEFEISEDIYLNQYIERLLDGSTESSSLLVTIIFSFFALFITTFFFLLKYRRKLMLEQLWGYSSWHALISIPKMFLFTYIFLCMMISAGVTLILIINRNGNYIAHHLFSFLISAIGVGITFLLFLAVGILLTKRFNAFALTLRGKSLFEKIQWASFAIKTVTSFTLLTVISSFILSIQNLNQEFYQLSYWRQAEHTYLLVGSVVGDGGGIWGTFIEDDGMGGEMEVSRIIDFERLNEREEAQRELFFLLEEHNNAFFLESAPFFRLELENGEWIYSYEWIRLMNEEEFFPDLLERSDEIDPLLLSWIESGVYNIVNRRILISQNYLLHNPIYGVNGANVLALVIDDPYTLNVLLPEHYQEFEADLETYFLNDFYFERIDLANWYQEELGLPLLDITMNDLSINFIYTQLGQSYFSFNRLIGDEHSLIWDPIVVIHHDEMAVANFANRVKSILYFMDDSRGHAFGNIQPFIDELGIHEIQSVISVFDQGNEELVIIQWQIFQQTLNLIMNFIFLILLSAGLIWSYYSLNVYKINLEYLFGYSYLMRNLELIIFAFSTAVIATALIIYSHGFSSMFVLFGLLIFMVDIIIISILGNHLTRKAVSNVIKGSEM